MELFFSSTFPRLHLSLSLSLGLWIMAMISALRRASCQSATSRKQAAPLLLGLAFSRHISTGFREERDTFGPILVPSDKSWSRNLKFLFYWFFILVWVWICLFGVSLGCGVLRRRDHCRILRLAASASACLSRSSALLVSLRSVRLRFVVFLRPKMTFLIDFSFLSFMKMFCFVLVEGNMLIWWDKEIFTF